MFAIGIGCSSRPDTSDKESISQATSAVPALPKLANPEQPAAGASEDVAGLKARVSADGRIKIEGTDVFGSKLDSIYESADYLANALPVLKRSLTPEQVDGLAKVVERLRGKILPPVPSSSPVPGKSSR
ncbi:MAG: hypothetical protein E6J90_13145 [Deltaproteobacteria bacterium]|nr:MAG: hypothetical protein E6J91_36310 [Deltaproteobacteria bacterium]TMQ21914.1 MAG: hypothetical protein E6J90_13145 [Deltaproteobacteria bacterium]